MGSYFIEVARKDMQKFSINLPDKDLAYFPRAPSTSTTTSKLLSGRKTSPAGTAT